MARAATKKDLLIQANEEYSKLNELISSMSKEEQEKEFLFEDRDRNVRDVLVHLYEWHQMLLNFVSANLNGEKKSFIPEPYNFRTSGVMNVEVIWKRHQSTSYPESKRLLNESHNKVIELIERFSNEELFERKHFDWTGTSTLGSYCVSAAPSHYNWAIKKIKKQKKALKETK